MNRRRRYKGWILVWGSSFLIGGLILYTGYLSALSESSQEKVRTTEKVQTVSSIIPESLQGKAGDGKVAETLQTKTGEQNSVDAQLGVSKSTSTAQDIRGEKIPVPKQVDLSVRTPNKKDFPSPVQGKLLRSVGNYYSSVFENYLFHGGMDYTEPEGTMIRATHGGKVIFAGPDVILGQKVVMDCGEGWMVTYGGLDNLRVHSGETIEAKQEVGQVGFFPGAEGASDQPQLHYEVWYGNVIQLPEPQN